MAVTVYGASDDLIEVEGDIEEEFSWAEDEQAYLAFSDGTLLTIDYQRDGVWRIAPVKKGTGQLEIKQAVSGDDDNFSDRAIITDSSIEWVVCGSEMATK